MRVIRFSDATNTIKLRPDSFDDLYLIQRIVGSEDAVTAKSYRRFKPTEEDVGEQKEITVKIHVEKTELDKGASKLRFTGKILWGRPEEFVKLSSYHTINVGVGDVLEIQKPHWREYMLRRIKQAVQDTKKPRLGVVALDEDAATIAYIRGYGIEIIAELRSHLSKRMKEKDYAVQREDYFKEIISTMKNMKVEMIAVAGPGFARDNLKRYISEKGIDIQRRLVYVPANDTERAGIREALQSKEVAQALTQEQVKNEFELLDKFLRGLSLSASFHGVAKVRESLDSYVAGLVMVNDSVLNDKQIQELLDIADRNKVKIEIFNSLDDAGMQLANFGNIASIAKRMLD